MVRGDIDTNNHLHCTPFQMPTPFRQGAARLSSRNRQRVESPVPDLTVLPSCLERALLMRKRVSGIFMPGTYIQRVHQVVEPVRRVRRVVTQPEGLFPGRLLKEVSMECPRCSGLMVRDHSFDYFVEEGHLSFEGCRWAWKCVGCGNFFDPVILRNRQGGGKLRATEAPPQIGVGGGT